MGSCRPGSQGGASSQLLAIIPANVLVSDPAADRLKFTIPIVLQQDLSTSRKWIAAIAADESSAYQMHASAVLRATVEPRHKGLRLEAEVRDLASQQNRQITEVTGPAQGGVVLAVNALAKRLDDSAVIFSTKSDQAAAAYTQAVATNKPEERLQLLDNAVRADPSFGLAYLALIDTMSQSSPQNVAALMATAATHRESFAPLDRARFDALVKRFSRVPLADQARATEAILKIAPNDVQALATLGDQRIGLGSTKEGERLLQQALTLAPDNLAIRRRLADVLLETGDTEGGLRLFSEYIAMRPADVQAKSSLAELQFQAQRFADAGKTLSDIGDNPGALQELAVCYLMQGDPARGAMTFEKYLSARQADNDPFVSIARATWDSISGQSAKAQKLLQTEQFPQDDLRAIAASQTAVWLASKKNFSGAKASASRAAQLAKAPIAKVLAGIAGLISQTDLPVEQWRQLVNASSLDEAGKEVASGYGLMLAGRYDLASQAWEDLLRRSNGSDVRARTMLAACLLHQGKTADAARLNPPLFFPNLTGGDQFAGLNFEEMLKVKAATARGDAAARFAKLAELYSP